MKRALKIILGAAGLLAYELLLDGSSVGMKARWAKVKAWAGPGAPRSAHP